MDRRLPLRHGRRGLRGQQLPRGYRSIPQTRSGHRCAWNGDIHLLGYRKTAIDDTGECPQVFMNFQAARASLDALHQALWSAAATTRQETYIDGDILKCLEHAL